MYNTILDTSAILAWYLDEPGNKEMDDILTNNSCCISSVNLAELVAKFTLQKIPESVIEEVIEDLSLVTIDFTEQLAIESGQLLDRT